MLSKLQQIFFLKGNVTKKCIRVIVVFGCFRDQRGSVTRNLKVGQKMHFSLKIIHLRGG